MLLEFILAFLGLLALLTPVIFYRKNSFKYNSMYYAIGLVLVGTLLMQCYEDSKETQNKNALIKRNPYFSAMRKIVPDEFEKLYFLVYSRSPIIKYYNDDYSEKNMKAHLEAGKAFGDKINKSFNIISDEAMREYGLYLIGAYTDFLSVDPTGILCFQMISPGIIGNPAPEVIATIDKDFAKQKNYLESFADSIAKGIQIDRLPAEQVKGESEKILTLLSNKYGDFVYVEDLHELSKKPRLTCEIQRDYIIEVMKLGSHLSAEILRLPISQPM
ncbi:hypothetical protein [Xenorhabdus bharatensis]|uniref:hypothetical protein n=1 Tax=Xenorhabdus bharatensis TaxID=3136256 RepID=UPI0030F37659